MSRELDARVARELMGFKDSRDCHHKPGDMLSPDGKIVPPPPYSADMNAAMEVVEKVHRWFKLISAHGSWFATFDLGNPDYEPCEADTPARAICLAALEAVKSTG